MLPYTFSTGELILRSPQPPRNRCAPIKSLPGWNYQRNCYSLHESIDRSLALFPLIDGVGIVKKVVEQRLIDL
jgi:hypothetical protein